MRELPSHVLRKTAKGRAYYYFVHPSLDERGNQQYIRLPDVSEASFWARVAELRELYPRRRKSPRWVSMPSKVYFIGGDIGAVKIGRAIRPNTRLKHLQMGSPIPLSILALTDGGAEVEAAYHARFANARVRGEWFDRTPEILAEIERLNK